MRVRLSVTGFRHIRRSPEVPSLRPRAACNVLRSNIAIGNGLTGGAIWAWEIMQTLNNYWVALLIGAFLLYFAFDFLLNFGRKARALGIELESALAAIPEITLEQSGGVTELDQIAEKVMRSDRLAHLWGEYTKTLHPQKELNSSGKFQVVRWRATCLAGTFFTQEAVVDSPLRIEYFKHIPGILTGIGIIGTFSGLILGLVHFDVSSDPALAEASLRELLNAVGHAFIVSGTAIALAMLFTGIEKRLIVRGTLRSKSCNKQSISFFRLVPKRSIWKGSFRATETSATQALQIKDSLVSDLKQVLAEITNLQVEASARHSSMISADVGRVIAESLGDPIERISHAVERVVLARVMR